MILRHTVTWLTPIITHNSELMPVKTWAILKTGRADVQPATLSENEVKLFGITDQKSNSKRVYFPADASIIEGLRMYYDGQLFDVRGGNPWTIHGVILAIPVIGESYTTPAPIITYFGPLSGAIGATVTIHGYSFVGASSVTIGAVSFASYTVVDSNTITGTIPSASISGKLSVTTTGGTGQSVETFTVTP
jgi:hypothetical protein